MIQKENLTSQININSIYNYRHCLKLLTLSKPNLDCILHNLKKEYWHFWQF